MLCRASQGHAIPVSPYREYIHLTQSNPGSASTHFYRYILYFIFRHTDALQCNVTFSALPPSPGPLPCTCGDAHHFGGLNGHFHTTFPKLVPSELCSPRWKQRKDSSSSNNSWISTYLLTTKPSCGLQRVALSSIWDLIGLSSTDSTQVVTLHSNTVVAAASSPQGRTIADESK